MEMTRRLATITAALLLVWLAEVQAQDKALSWGSIRGQVVYNGPRPPEPVKLRVNPLRCKGPLFGEDWVVRKEGMGVRDVFLWLEDPAGKPLPVHPTLRAVPQEDAALDQPNGQFVPHVLALRQGQPLLVKNSSPVAHHVVIQGHPLVNPGRDFPLPAAGSAEVTGLQADRLPLQVTCHIDPWMMAWVRVFDHPYYAVADANGRFEVRLAPSGKYRLKVWHPASGWLGGAKGRAGLPITIQAGHVADLGQLRVGPKELP
jgi:hypothetical protein